MNLKNIKLGKTDFFWNFFHQESLRVSFFGHVATLVQQRSHMVDISKKAAKWIAETDKFLGGMSTNSNIDKPRNYEEEKKFWDKKFVEQYRPFILQTILVNSVDNFLIYLSDLLAHIFKHTPQMLYSKHEKLSIEDVMSFDNKNELISWIAEKKVIDLTYKSFEDLNNYLIQEYKFCLITDLNQINKIAKLIYYRNLLVHNRGIINHKFLKLFPEKKLGEKLELDSSFVFGSSNFLLEISAEIDEVAIKKYSLTRVKRDDSDCPTK